MDGERRILPVGKEGELLVHEDDLQGGTGLLDLVALDADYDADMEETMEETVEETVGVETGVEMGEKMGV